MKDWKKYLTPPNVIILLFMIYFIILNERKIYINTGPDLTTIQFEKDMILMNARVQEMERADSIHLQNIVDYAKQIVENNVRINNYSNEQLDSAFAALTAGK